MAAVTYDSQSDAQEITRMANGQFTTAGSSDDAVLTLGFRPRFIEIVDETLQATFIWTAAMGVTDILKRVDNGDATMDTSLIITASDSGFTFACADSTVYQWVAFG